MERILTGGRVPGGIGRILLLAASGALIAAGTGCLNSKNFSAASLNPLGHYFAPKPATELIAAFNPQIRHLPDATQDGAMRPGIVGQLFLLASDGKYTEVNGDLVVQAVDATVRPPGQPKAITEVWHFDLATLKKFKTRDERFGECYALFLPWPSNWKDVTQLSLSTRYEPKADAVNSPKLTSPTQDLTLDFTAPGSPVWTDKGGLRATAPAELTAIPNVKRDMAKGMGAPLTGPQAAPKTDAVAMKAPPLLPKQEFGGTNGSVIETPGTNGSRIQTTAFALPPGVTVPPGWQLQADGSILPKSGDPTRVQVPPAVAPATNPPVPMGRVLPPVGQPIAPLQPVTQPMAPVTQPITTFDPNSPVGNWANLQPPPASSGLTTIALPANNNPLPIPTAPSVETNSGIQTITLPRR